MITVGFQTNYFGFLKFQFPWGFYVPVLYIFSALRNALYLDQEVRVLSLESEN